MSTIITDNPYTFTVADNMNINAVFEDNEITVITNASDSLTLINSNDETYTWNLSAGTNTYNGSVSGFELENITGIYKFTTYANNSSKNTSLNYIDISCLSNMTKVPNYAFSGCSGLTTIVLPDSVDTLGKYSFSAICGLTNFETKATTIDNQVFYGSNNLLASISIPNVKSIGDEAFYGNKDLTSIDLPNTLTVIGDAAFRGCSGLTTFTIPSSVDTIYRLSFGTTKWWNDQPDDVMYKDNICFGYNTTQPTGALTIHNGGALIANKAFSGCTGLTSVVLQDTVFISTSAFSGCTNLTSITLPNTLKTIKSSAFNNCTKLTTFTIPSSVEYISRGSFNTTKWWNDQPDTVLYKDNICLGYKTTKPTGALTINSGTRVIAATAFYNCTGLTSITIPDSVEYIWGAWGNCTITSTTIYATTPPYKESSNTFGSSSVIYVPSGSVDAYKEAWPELASNIQPIP